MGTALDYEQAVADALKKIRSGAPGAAAEALQACLTEMRGAASRSVAGGVGSTRKRGNIIPFHRVVVPNITALAPNATGNATSQDFPIVWPTIGKRMRVVRMAGTVLSGAAADRAGISMRLTCNGNESLVSTGIAATFGSYSCLFPTAEPQFSFVSAARPHGVLVTPNDTWFVMFRNETTGTTITPWLEFEVECDEAESDTDFDAEAYGRKLGVRIVRPDIVSSIPNAAGATNPSPPIQVKFPTRTKGQRITHWVGGVTTPNNIQDQSNATVSVSPNGAEQMVTTGKANAFSNFAATFGNDNGLPSRWAPFATRDRYGMPVAPDEFWNLSFQNLGSAAGNIVPLLHFRVEQDEG